MDSNREQITYFSIFRYSKYFEKLLIFIGAVIALVGGALTPIMYIYIGSFVNDIITDIRKFENTSSWLEKSEFVQLYDSSTEFIFKMSMLGFFVLVCAFLENASFNYVSLKQIYRLRLSYFEKILNQDISWYDTCKSNTISTDMTENIAKVEEGIGEKLSTFLSYVGMFITCILVAFSSGWELALICMISLPACTVAIGLSTWIMAKFVKNEMDAYSTAGSIAEEVLSAVKTVVAFEGQTKEIDRYSKEIQIARNNNSKRALFSSSSQAIVWLLMFSCYGLSFWYGLKLIKRDMYEDVPDGYTPGKLMTVFFSSMGASIAFASASPLIDTFKVSTEATRQIFNVLESISTINCIKIKGLNIKNPNIQICFKNVSFSYPSRPDVKVLDNFNLNINPGETVALVGNSGSGKSTVFQLLLRYYDPTIGNVFMDGTNIKDLNLNSLRNIIGTVWQEPILFDATINENIWFANPHASKEDIILAAKQANVHDFIETLPNGYDSSITGTKISGGQKQRISIARALAKKPKILLLDEATSALDMESEAAIHHALKKRSDVCTTLIISHRITTIRHADRIVVMNDGKIVEQGTHSELLDLKGQYYRLASKSDSVAADTENRLNYESCISPDVGLIEKDAAFTETTSKRNKRTSLLKKLIALNKPERWQILLGALAAILNSASLPIYAILFGDIIQAFAESNINYISDIINWYCILFLLLGCFCGLTTFVQMYMLDIAGQNLTMRLRKCIFQSFLEREMAWFDEPENSVGSLCAVLAGESANVQAASGMCVGTVLNATGTFLLCIAVAFYYQWKLTLFCCIIPVTSLVIVICEQFYSQKHQAAIQTSVENSLKIALQAVSNIRTVASLGCEEKFLKLYRKELKDTYKKAVKGAILHSFANVSFKAMPVFTYGLCIYYGAHLILHEKIQSGSIFKVSETILLASMTVANTVAFIPNIGKALMAAKRVLKFIDYNSKITIIEEEKTNSSIQGNVNFFNVHFSYPTRPTTRVLEEFNLNILHCKRVALVGASGCGKSTVIQLLERFYNPNSGSICIDGRNIKTFEIGSLRRQLSIVSQEPNLFNRTIAENIAYGDNFRDVTKEEIVNAAKIANIHSFIIDLPLGYNTHIGKNGTQLSGGQKQRVAIARALVRNSKILLLDEATSALDSENEKIVLEALNRARMDTTFITITHRLSIVRDFDIICVIHNGKIVEMGSHASLMQKKGLYFQYFSLHQ